MFIFLSFICYNSFQYFIAVVVDKTNISCIYSVTHAQVQFIQGHFYLKDSYIQLLRFIIVAIVGLFVNVANT